MRSSRVWMRYSAALSVGLAACNGGGGKGGEEGSGPTEQDVIGYYSYADAVRGEFHLAILENNRFMLVASPTRARAIPSEPGAPGQEAQPTSQPTSTTGDVGEVGWYVLRGDTLLLSSDDLDARAVVGEGGILDVEIRDPILAGVRTGDSDAMPFRRVETEGAPAGEKGGQGGGGGGQGGDPGGGDQGGGQQGDQGQ